MAQGSRASGTTLNLINPLKQPPITSLNPNQPGALQIDLARTASSGSVGEQRDWVLSELLQMCNVNSTKRDKILRDTSATDFLAEGIVAHMLARSPCLATRITAFAADLRREVVNTQGDRL